MLNRIELKPVFNAFIFRYKLNKLIYKGIMGVLKNHLHFIEAVSLSVEN